MNSRWPRWLVGGAVAVLIALACLHPTAMLAPGHLSAAHQPLGEDCFACHQPGHGATSSRCISCHVLAEIGRRDTQHRTLPTASSRTSFHQQLREKNCLACHTGHAGYAALLPKRQFSHALLEPHINARCNVCHSPPQDGLHAGSSEQCSTCHQQQGWRPATIEHTHWFPLTGVHAATCDTCHQRRNFKVYTCYGCHEHSPEGMRAAHAEEGIRTLNDCVRCHRSGGEGGEDD